MCTTSFRNPSIISKYRKFWWALIIANFAGAVYGYYWYAGQLAHTPFYLWPFTPDCPLFASLLALVLYLELRGKGSGWLATITFLGLVKYGIWTVVVISAYGLQGGDLLLEDYFLILSHFGMFCEGALLLALLTWRANWVLGATLFFVTWDWFDYVVGTYPYLPAANLLPLAHWLAVALTLFLTGFSWWQVLRRASQYR